MPQGSKRQRQHRRLLRQQQTPAAPLSLTLDQMCPGHVRMDGDTRIRFARETDPAAALLHTHGLGGCTALAVITAHTRTSYELRLLHSPDPDVFMPVLQAALHDPRTAMVLLKTPAHRDRAQHGKPVLTAVDPDIRDALARPTRAPVATVLYAIADNASRALNQRGNRSKPGNSQFAVSAAATDQGIYVNYTDNAGLTHTQHLEHQQP